MVGIATAWYVGEKQEDAADKIEKATDRASELSAIAAEQARTDVEDALPTAQEQLSSGFRQAQSITGLKSAQQIAELTGADRRQREAITSGFGQWLQTLQGAQASGLGQIASGFGQSRQDIGQGLTAGLGEVEQYAATGEQALQQEAAMAGALGPEAQAQAMQAYSESPGQKFLRERQEQSLLRNSAAIGGLGGGNVRTALQEQAFGIASTDQQRYMDNLSNLASRGQNAATAQADMQTGAGSNLANIAAQQGMTEAQLIQQLQSAIGSGQIQQGQQVSNIAGQTGTNIANIMGADKASRSSLYAQRGQGLAGLTTGAATTLANIAVGQGTQQAQFAQDIGSAQAAAQIGKANAYSQGIQNVAGLAGLGAGLYYGM